MAKKIIEWIKYAIDVEKKGISFYTECLNKCQDSSAKELFSFLIKEEAAHMGDLTKHLDKVSKGQAVSKTSNFRKIRNPLFEEQEISRIVDENLIGMLYKAKKFEEEGVKFYRKWEKIEEMKDVRNLFRKLANDEIAHIETIERFSASHGLNLKD